MRRRLEEIEELKPVQWDAILVLVLLAIAVLALITFEVWAPHAIPWH
jgi:hypothetical protein